jgi:putative tryptophan/tyrosine transport system substrate-binding protein
MRRREFIAGLGSAALWPLAAQAQQPVVPVVGFLNSQSAQNYQRQLAAFLDGLAEAGYVDGRNTGNRTVFSSCSVQDRHRMAFI